ncbi:proline iminopeptidase [Kiloniella litopenaei]|uniref:Proline iminopeptidase n=1 Tax=Kiloniella litopenaei TaxID=1549748 RepID=A0A0M2REK8_9PROT|nr:prolyl aminopeptidase [Kiloniella litopenaei]KKJ78008.1 proline iminopeptidase [Kiloniella litopenaei]
MNPKDLYPEIEPYDMGFLSVGDEHEIYWEVSGNPQGKPVLFVHGGPGAGTGAAHRRFFDPAHYRIVLFDQRGCGKSLPLGSLENNDTPHLIADMELLREKLDIESWIVFGGSWGSTLSLAYAQAHPKRTDALVVRGIFLSRPKELEWYLSEQGVGSIFPEAYDDFISLLDEKEREDVLGSYYKRLTDPDPSVHLPAAKSWSSYEASCVTLLPNPEIVKASLDDERALPVGRLIAHYFVNGCFLPEGGLLGGIDRIRNIPAVIVHGRYDIVCPASTAYDLHKAWPEAEFKFIDDAGHSAFEPGIAKALVEAMDKFRTLN